MIPLPESYWSAARATQTKINQMAAHIKHTAFGAATQTAAEISQQPRVRRPTNVCCNGFIFQYPCHNDVLD